MRLAPRALSLGSPTNNHLSFSNQILFMFTDYRIDLYRRTLDEALRKGEQVVIFEDPASGKFVQFAVESESRELIVDIPLEQMTETIYEWLRPHMEQAVDSKGNLMALQKIIKSDHLQYAAEFTDWIFTKIYQLPENHEVTVQMFT
jgi:hypothetical protein